jgi:hypothetical protein
MGISVADQCISKAQHCVAGCALARLAEMRGRKHANALLL